MAASLEDLVKLVSQLSVETSQADETRATRDRVMAELHQAETATHRQLAKITGMAVSGVRAAINRTHQ